MARTSQAQSGSIDRRTLLQAGTVAIGAAGMPLVTRAVQDTATPATGDELPVTGEEIPELAVLDSIMSDVMSRWSVPGAQLAIARDDRLTYNRGFGHASVEDQEPVSPGTLFRIASTSKPITAVAILMLVDAGLIGLDTPVFPRLDYDRLPNAPYDTRLDQVTVEHLLVHAGGWNSAASYDPQYLPWPLMASHLLQAADPAEAETIVRFMLSQPLDFDPGIQSAYSNFGFNVLGRVIEHATGQPYETWVLDNMLVPAGITRMAIGGTSLAERKEGEARYYAPPGQDYRVSVYPGEGFVPVGYGSFYLRSLDAHGGWIASAADLIRFTLAIDGTRGPALLASETVTAMETTPRPPAVTAGAGNVEKALGLGWNSVPTSDGYEWSHAGALEGSNASWLVRRPDGITLATVFNTLPTDYEAFFGDLFPQLMGAVAGTTGWPDIDLFDAS